MPNLDMTGPAGQGPMTGEGQGLAVQGPEIDFAACVRREVDDTGLSPEEARRVCSYIKRQGGGVA